MTLNAIPTTALEYVEALEASAGDLEIFCSHQCPTPKTAQKAWLFQIESRINADADLALRWRKAIRLGMDLRLRLLQCKAMGTLEDWANKSETNSMPDVQFAKVVLADMLSGKIEAAKRKAAHPYVRELAGSQVVISDEDDEDSELEKLESEMST